MSSDKDRQSILKFVADGPAMLTLSRPEIGYEASPVGVVLMNGRDEFLVFDSHDENLNANVVRFKAVLFPTADTAIITLDHDLAMLMTLRRAQTQEERDHLEARVDMIEDNIHAWRSMLATRLRQAESLTRVPEPTKRFRFSRWLEWEKEIGAVPAGVVLMAEDTSGFTFFGFPGYEDAAERHTSMWQLGAPAINVEDIFHTLQDSIGSRSSVAAREAIMAASWDDAAERAAYRFVRDVYQETGKAVVG